MGIANVVARARLPQLGAAAFATGIAAGVGSELAWRNLTAGPGSGSDPAAVVGLIGGSVGLCAVSGIGLPGPVIDRWSVDGAERIARTWVDLRWSEKMRRGGVIAAAMGAALLLVASTSSLITPRH